MAVSKKLRALYNNFFDGIETYTANIISNYQEHRTLRKYITKAPIPVEFANQIKEFWKPWTKVSPKWAWYYASQNGILDPRYVPNDIYYTKIDQHFNQRKLGWGFNDKNYYSKIFAGIKQPKTIVRNIGGIIENEEYEIISKEEALNKIFDYKEVICKPALESGSGRDIRFWRIAEDKDAIIDFVNQRNEKDWLVQEIIAQHDELNRIHAKSVNSVRIVSILMPEGVYILSTVLRMGTNNNRVDNASAGGISCGIKSDGYLKENGTLIFSSSGNLLRQHPQGVVFKDFKVPSFDNAIQLVKKAHPLIPHFRLVSWDLAIGSDGDPILIEANMRKGGLEVNQFNNGPLFGDMTERVLNEVFNK